MKRQMLIGVVTAALLSGCGDGGEQYKREADTLRTEIGGLRSELSKATEQLKQLESENFELKQTPQVLLAKVRALTEAKDEANAKLAQDELTVRHPGSPEILVGRGLYSDMIKAREAKEKESARLASLGFKAIPIKNVFAGNSTTVDLKSAQIGSTWKFNDHGDEYEYRTADRGTKYVTAQVVYSSRDNAPKLIPMAVYSSVAGKLKRVGVMAFEFVSWKNYATFLGNYHDTGNDFANSERIRFSMGLQVKNEDLSKPLYLVAAKTGCADRSEDRFGNPPVKYYTYSCNSFPDVLSVEDFSKGELGIIKRLD